MNNPAARLLKPLRAVAGMRNNGNPAWPIWCDILEVDKNDYPLVVGQLAELYKLPSEIKSQIERIPDINHKMYLRWVPNVTTAMQNAPWNAGINQFAQHLDPTVLQGLEFCDELLSRVSPERELNADELRDLSSQIRELLEEVESSSVEPALKQFMLHHLDKVKLALRSYLISGALPIQDAFNSVIGSAASNIEVAQKVTSTEVGKKFWKVVRKAAIILSVSSNLIQLVDKASTNPDTLKLVEEALTVLPEPRLSLTNR